MNWEPTCAFPMRILLPPAGIGFGTRVPARTGPMSRHSSRITCTFLPPSSFGRTTRHSSDFSTICRLLLVAWRPTLRDRNSGSQYQLPVLLVVRCVQIQQSWNFTPRFSLSSEMHHLRDQLYCLAHPVGVSLLGAREPPGFFRTWGDHGLMW